MCSMISAYSWSLVLLKNGWMTLGDFSNGTSEIIQMIDIYTNYFNLAQEVKLDWQKMYSYVEKTYERIENQKFFLSKKIYWTFFPVFQKPEFR